MCILMQVCAGAEAKGVGLPRQLESHGLVNHLVWVLGIEYVWLSARAMCFLDVWTITPAPSYLLFDAGTSSTKSACGTGLHKPTTPHFNSLPCLNQILVLKIDLYKGFLGSLEKGGLWGKEGCVFWETVGYFVDTLLLVPGRTFALLLSSIDTYTHHQPSPHSYHPPPTATQDVLGYSWQKPYYKLSPKGT